MKVDRKLGRKQKKFAVDRDAESIVIQSARGKLSDVLPKEHILSTEVLTSQTYGLKKSSNHFLAFTNIFGHQISGRNRKKRWVIRFRCNGFCKKSLSGSYKNERKLDGISIINGDRSGEDKDRKENQKNNQKNLRAKKRFDRCGDRFL